MSLLRYEDLCISFGTGRREKFAVNHLDLEIGIGERVALVGESGSGKTLTALAPLRLEPEGAKVSGKILWNRKDGKGEVDLLSMSIQDIREIRGREIAMVFQEPMTALNPVQTVGRQLGEADRLLVVVRQLLEPLLDGIPAGQPGPAAGPGREPSRAARSGPAARDRRRLPNTARLVRREDPRRGDRRAPRAVRRILRGVSARSVRRVSNIRSGTWHRQGGFASYRDPDQ